MITLKVILTISNNSEIVEYTETLAFWNGAVWDKFQNINTATTAKEKSILLGVGEQSISRTYKISISWVDGGVYEH